MEQYHPIVNFIYFGLMIGCGMVFLHPVCLLISIICAAYYTILLFGRRRAVKGFLGVAVLMLLTALINPTFSHQGVTELFELPGGNMLTLESILFGIGAAFMLGATLLWFRIASEILTADKIVYLFGRTFPILGLLLSMILGFIPKVRRKYLEIVMCQRHSYEKKSNVYIDEKYMNTHQGDRQLSSKVRKGFYKLRRFVKEISILITWMLEDSVEMGKSMKGRGYGLPGRTGYSIYRFTKRDARLLIIMIILGGYVIAGSIQGALAWYYYPVTTGAGAGIYSISVFVAYAALMAGPIVSEAVILKRYKRRNITMYIE